MPWWREEALERGRAVLKAGREIAAVHETLSKHQEQLNALSADVADLKRKQGLIPKDVKLHDGIPWGLVGTDADLHPFCPSCAGNDRWTPVPRTIRRADWNYFHCAVCKANHQLTPGLRDWMGYERS